MIGIQARVQPVKKEQASEAIRTLLDETQNTMGTPWPAALWRVYAMYPRVARLFWDRLRPAVDTEPFLRDALEITRLAYAEAARWYLPSHLIDEPEPERPRIQWELDAFEFGNPQLLIQQEALNRAIRGQIAGMDGTPEPRQQPGKFRQPEIRMISEDEASPEIRRIYEDIKQALGLPVVNSDYQAMAKWPTLLAPAWEDLKLWRIRREYQSLLYQIDQRAVMAAGRLCPPVAIDLREVQDALDDPAEMGNLRVIMELFRQLLPGLIANDAILRVAVSAGQPVMAPPPEGIAAPEG